MLETVVYNDRHHQPPRRRMKWRAWPERRRHADLVARVSNRSPPGVAGGQRLQGDRLNAMLALGQIVLAVREAKAAAIDIGFVD